MSWQFTTNWNLSAIIRNDSSYKMWNFPPSLTSRILSNPQFKIGFFPKIKTTAMMTSVERKDIPLKLTCFRNRYCVVQNVFLAAYQLLTYSGVHIKSLFLENELASQSLYVIVKWIIKDKLGEGDTSFLPVASGMVLLWLTSSSSFFSWGPFTPIFPLWPFNQPPSFKTNLKNQF